MATAVVADNRVDLVGAWRTFDHRKLDIVTRIVSSRITGKSRRIESTAEYHIGRAEVAADTEAIAIWTFHKTLPEDRTYQVILHRDGQVSCECPHHEYRKEGDLTLCVHQATVLTIADAFKELILPIRNGDLAPSESPE